MPDLQRFAAAHALHILSVADVIQYRMHRESLVRRGAEARVPTEFGGDMRCIAYENDVDSAQHVAFVKGTWEPDEPVLVRVHSKCLTGDVFGSRRCDCGPQLHRALQMIDEAGKGVLVYLDQEGRGIGLVNKLKAYNLQDEGHDTVEANVKLGFKADLRDYGIGAQILRDVGVRKLRLMTNNPKKIDGLKRLYDLEVVERVPIEAGLSHENEGYLQSKRDKMGHLLSLTKKWEAVIGMSKGTPPGRELPAQGLRIAIVATRWNDELVEQLLQGAQAALERRKAAQVDVYRCSGVFELGPLAARVARKGGIDGIVALGCLIRGGTDHYRVLCDEVTRALGALALECGTSPQPVAVAFGVLTCETLEQAQERADPRGADKGGEAALACVEQIHALRAVAAE
jgi:6,7-dimethyl-8-ribityllumazine synthase